MGAQSLGSASAYLNNLLLSRGLLQNGKPIDFASPEHHGSTETTMSQVINLVHDLVLRRDKDAEQKEALAANIRAIRIEEGQRVLDLQRTQDKNAELSRELATVQGQDRALRMSARKAESKAKELKEQMLKMKSTLDQVRAKCLSDVRKRDVEIEKLKGHLSGMQRGKREASGMKVNSIQAQTATIGGRELRGGQVVHSVDWSLEKETNDFLATLVNETTAENIALRKVLGDTMNTLKHLTGFDTEEEEVAYGEDDSTGIPGQYRKSRLRAAETTQQESLVSCETLAAQMSEIMDHCKTILKDPSFVPIEEVQVREEEIVKLREGWEKMANRWEEAVTMMDIWRRKMVGDESVDANEMSHLNFSRSIAVMPDGQPVLEQDDELSSVLFDTSRMNTVPEQDEHQLPADENDQGQGEATHEVEAESESDLPVEPYPKRLAASPARRGVKLPRPVEVLQEVNGNVVRSSVESDTLSPVLRGDDSGIGSLDGSVNDIENDTFQHKAHPAFSKQASLSYANSKKTRV